MLAGATASIRRQIVMSNDITKPFDDDDDDDKYKPTGVIKNVRIYDRDCTSYVGLLLKIRFSVNSWNSEHIVDLKIDGIGCLSLSREQALTVAHLIAKQFNHELTPPLQAIASNLQDDVDHNLYSCPLCECLLCKRDRLSESEMSLLASSDAISKAIN